MSKMQHLVAQPFPFLELPPELRDMVYEYLVEDPHYPPPTPNTSGSPLMNWLIPSQKTSILSKQEQRNLKGSCILLVNKQISAEFTEVVCKKATFHLSVTPTNDPKAVHIPTTSTTITTTSTSTPGTTTPSLWKINPFTLKAIRKCDIQLIISSAMPGVPDPREMKPDSWALAHQIRAELKHVKKIQELNLHVEAIGNPLWNPLWVWYHASQSFKNMGVAPAPSPLPILSPTLTPTTHPHTQTCSRAHDCSRITTPEHNQDEEPTGPKLNRLTFSLDGWSPGENYLARDHENEGQWAWWCTKGHCIGPDGGMDMPVREFCAKLYMECRTCRPELEDEEDESLS